MTKHIVLCADDYGQTPAISSGILSLLELGRLSATSCMVNLPHWPAHAEWLKPYQAKADIGLHFNLTEGQPLSSEFCHTYGNQFSHLSRLMMRAMLRQLDIKIMAAECRAQILQFANAFGVLPDFIDGHQHVHQFPLIREIVLNIYEKRLRASGCYIRSVNQTRLLHRSAFFKKLIIQWMGAGIFKKLLCKQAVPHNHSFSGIYSFKVNSDYATIFRQFLKNIENGALVMSHPGLQIAEVNDPMAAIRFNEFCYLNSDQFLKDCQAQGIQISRFKNI